MSFIPIQYGNTTYPSYIKCDTREVAGHFDKMEISCQGKFSLHTEYSYGKRTFNTPLIKQFDALKNAQKDGIPQLWYNAKWANEFADFIFELVATNALNSSTSSIQNAPTIIEIHPPFNDYCDFDTFFSHFEIFEKKIHAIFPRSKIVIENRVGTVYRGGRFIMQKASEIATLCETIIKNGVKLGVVLDFPQLLTAEKIDTLNFNQTKFKVTLNTLSPFKEQIDGIHIWAKKKNPNGRWVSHCGNFETFFDNDNSVNFFVSEIKDFCNDGKERYFVPEVNSGENDLQEIIRHFF